MEQIAIVDLNPKQLNLSKLWVIPKDYVSLVYNTIKTLHSGTPGTEYYKNAEKEWENFSSNKGWVGGYSHLFDDLDYVLRDIHVTEIFVFPRYSPK